MAVQCDACRSELPAGTRFCPRCGLEVVPVRERQSRPPALHKEVFDWDEQDGQPEDYAVLREQQPRPATQRLAEILEQAKTRLADGCVIEATAMLKQVRPHVARHVTLRTAYERLQKIIEARKQAIRDRCQTMADAGDSDRLVALLSGPAANELELEEICAVALAAVRTLYEAQLADEAVDVLRLSAFRTLRDEQLVKEHRELETLVHRRRHWQHWRQSVTVLGGVSMLAGIGLAIWAWFIWQTGSGVARSLFVPGLIAAACFLVIFPKLRPHLEKWLRQYFEDDGPRKKLKGYWMKLIKRRR